MYQYQDQDHHRERHPRHVSRSRRAQVAMLVCALVAVNGMSGYRSASAKPYALYAKYAGTGDNKDLELELRDGISVPELGDGYRLKSLVLRVEKRGLASASVSSFQGIEVGVRLGTRTDKHPVETTRVTPANISDTKDIEIYSWDPMAFPRARTIPVAIDLRGRFSEHFLCSQELHYRASKGKPWPDGSRAALRAGLTDLLEKPPERAIYDGETPLLYSFCSPDSVAWHALLDNSRAQVRGLLSFGDEREPNAIKREHRQRLARLLVKEGLLATHKSVNVHEEGQADDAPPMFMPQELAFTVLRTGGLFSLHEEATKIRRGSATHVAQTSRIALALARDRGEVCVPVDPSGFVIRLSEVKADQPSQPVAVELRHRDECTWLLDVDLSKYLDDEVNISVNYRFAGNRELTVFQSSFEVIDVGFVTSFPVISEVVTAVQGMSLDDVSATSSVPVAYAVKLNGDADRSRLAVMFPWKLGYNPRSAPNLARYLTVFPHLSVLVGSGDGADVEVAFGAGVALADAIHLAWGMTRARDQFMFIGVDVKDIAQALK